MGPRVSNVRDRQKRSEQNEAKQRMCFYVAQLRIADIKFGRTMTCHKPNLKAKKQCVELQEQVAFVVN